jgi:hypothetical protein
VLAAACAVGAQSAQSQRPASPNTERAVVLAHLVGKCFVERNRAVAVRLLEQVPMTIQETSALRSGWRTYRDCYRDIGREESELRAPITIIRGQFAEALYEEDFDRSGRPRRRSLAALPDPDALLAGAPVGAGTRRSAVAGRFAACVARARPQETAQVLATPPGSAEEQSAMERLVPQFRPCHDGGDLQINYPLFRGFLAEGLYRRGAALSRQGTLQ